MHFFGRVVLGVVAVSVCFSCGSGGTGGTGGGSGGGSGGASSVINGYQAATLSAANAKEWSGTSAPSMYLVSIITANAGLTSDGGCPSRTDDGTTVTITGGNCTDDQGKKWNGTVKFVRKAAGSSEGTYTLNGLETVGVSTCQDGGSGTADVTLDGTVTLTGSAADNTTVGSGSFTIDMKETLTGYDTRVCTTRNDTVGWTYSGTLVTSAAGSSTWNGSGKFGSKTDGVVTVSTKDEVVDSAKCSSEASSGSTTVTAGSNTIVYTYDGASKCDTDSRVKWSLNGTDQGELAGVNCASVPGLWWLAGLGVALFLARRR